MEHLTSLTDLTLLDVFAGAARTWARDGLLLIGDCAHTHGPIGAQGVNLAIQDAAVAHEILLRSLHAKDASAGTLAEFETRRRPAIERVTRLQARQGKAMLSSGPVAKAIRPVAARLLAHTPVHRKILDQIAFGDRTVRVHSELLVAQRTADGARQ
jgi:monooxygenase